MIVSQYLLTVNRIWYGLALGWVLGVDLLKAKGLLGSFGMGVFVGAGGAGRRVRERGARMGARRSMIPV